MAYNLKGFLSISPLIKNQVGVNSALGEISTWSMTFTKERGEYFNTSIPLVKLVSISSLDNEVKVPVDNAVADHVLTVAKHLYDYSITKNGIIYQDELLVELQTQYNSVTSGFQIGPIIQQDTVYLPAWISWKKPGPTPTDPVNNIKIWLSDLHFQREFSEYEIIIIPPIDNLDSFFLTPTDVKTIVDAKSISNLLEDIQTAKTKHPETITAIETYDYVNPNYAGVKIPTNWGILIYGPAGNNPDSIKDAIVDYILSHSTHPREDWVKIFPEIFKRTEFIILPRWDLYAIPNMTIQAGLHSPIVNLTESIAFTKLHIPRYTPNWIEEYTDVMSHPYKSMAMTITGNYENRDAKYRIKDYFPDYIAVGTPSIDFNRMSQDTKDWSLMVERLLVAAETVTEGSDVPQQMRRVKRDNHLFIVQRFNKVQYMVAAKVNYGV